MKKFNDVGYIAMRVDSDNRHYGHFRLEFVLIDEEGRRDGVRIASIQWQTDNDYPTEHRQFPYWYGASLDVGTGNRSHTDQLEHMERGMEVLKFVVKHFGYSVPREILADMPEANAMRQARESLADSKRWSYDGFYPRMQPEVLVWIGMPSLNIPRVVWDKRFGKTVPAEQVESPNLFRWRAVADFDNWIGTGLAGDHSSAQDAVEEEVRAELAKIEFLTGTNQVDHEHRSKLELKWCWGHNKAKYVEVAHEWLNSGRPVIGTGAYAPKVSPLMDLLDCYSRYNSVRAQY